MLAPAGMLNVLRGVGISVRVELPVRVDLLLDSEAVLVLNTVGANIGFLNWGLGAGVVEIEA